MVDVEFQRFESAELFRSFMIIAFYFEERVGSILGMDVGVGDVVRSHAMIGVRWGVTSS